MCSTGKQGVFGEEDPNSRPWPKHFVPHPAQAVHNHPSWVGLFKKMAGCLGSDFAAGGSSEPSWCLCLLDAPVPGLAFKFFEGGGQVNGPHSTTDQWREIVKFSQALCRRVGPVPPPPPLTDCVSLWQINDARNTTD